MEEQEPVVVRTCNVTGQLHIWCNGCNRVHAIWVEGIEQKRPKWEWNGSYTKPTFSPSILVTTGHHPDPSDICHSFIKDGVWEYLGDCTHHLKGQKVPMIPF